MGDDSAQPPRVTDLGYCRWCARSVHTASFSDDVSHRAYCDSATCQVCFDALSNTDSGVERDHSAPVLHGTVFGAVVAETVVREVALLPFQYDAWYARFEWEPGDIVRAGEVLEPLDPLGELAAVRPAWAGPCERVLLLDSLADPLLGTRTVRSHLVVALDGVSAAAAAELNPTLRRPPLVDLGAAVPWAETFGAPFEELVRAHGRGVDGGSVSALRQCAIAARLLELPAPAGRHEGATALEHVLFGISVPGAGTSEPPGDAPH